MSVEEIRVCPLCGQRTTETPKCVCATCGAFFMLKHKNELRRCGGSCPEMFRARYAEADGDVTNIRSALKQCTDCDVPGGPLHAGKTYCSARCREAFMLAHPVDVAALGKQGRGGLSDIRVIQRPDGISAFAVGYARVDGSGTEATEDK